MAIHLSYHVRLPVRGSRTPTQPQILDLKFSHLQIFCVKDAAKIMEAFSQFLVQSETPYLKRELNCEGQGPEAGYTRDLIQKLTTKHLTGLRQNCRRQGGRIIVVSNSGVKGTKGKPKEPTNLCSQGFTETEGTNREPALDIVLQMCNLVFYQDYYQ